MEKTINRPPIICLCGSTKFYDEFMSWNKVFTLIGYIVLMPGVFIHQDSTGTYTAEEKLDLDELHREKIKLADQVAIVNKNNYIGESTKNEINFAKELNKPVTYLYGNNKEA